MTNNNDSPGTGYYKLLSFKFQPDPVAQEDGTFQELPPKRLYFFSYLPEENRAKCAEEYDIPYYRVMKDVCDKSK
jgi:hypothetical protein